MTAQARIRPAPRVDWNRVMLNLRSEGYSMHDVSSLTGIPRSTLKSWSHLGCNPNHQDGETLVAFWCEAMQLPRESLPTVAAHLAGARLYANR